VTEFTAVRFIRVDAKRAGDDTGIRHLPEQQGAAVRQPRDRQVSESQQPLMHGFRRH
jgi:hypothetical protein